MLHLNTLLLLRIGWMACCFLRRRRVFDIRWLRYALVSLTLRSGKKLELRR